MIHPRYIAYWANGYWSVFDRVRFEPGPPHTTQQEAQAEVNHLNRRITPRG